MDMLLNGLLLIGFIFVSSASIGLTSYIGLRLMFDSFREKRPISYLIMIISMLIVCMLGFYGQAKFLERVDSGDLKHLNPFIEQSND